jgi:2-methylcitrate dehydratase PrpD
MEAGARPDISDVGVADGADRLEAYAVAFIDWLACACAGREERAARAAASSGSDLFTHVATVGTAGHVLDFDDTFPEGIAHVSAATGPAALVLAAHRGLTIGDALEAYAAGFEAMAAVAEASHPALYTAGWHPTTVCGPIGAAVATAYLLGLDERQRDIAMAAALLGTGGSRGAFGSDGKSLQVGLAAAAGVRGALMAEAGVTVGQESIRDEYGFESTFGATVPETMWSPPAVRAIDRNWLKLYPSCLGTHAAVDAVLHLRADSEHPSVDRRIEVSVHPVGRQAAHRDATVSDGLGAKFSIPYCVAYALLNGRPLQSSFSQIDPDVSVLAAAVRIGLDESLPEFGATVRIGDRDPLTVPYPSGAPNTSVTAADLEAKIRDLTADRLAGALDDRSVAAAAVLTAAGLALS